MAVQWPNPAIRSRRNLRKTSSSIMGATITADKRTVQTSIDPISSCMSLTIGSPFRMPATVIRMVPMRLPTYKTPMDATKNPHSFPKPHLSRPTAPVFGTHFMRTPVRGTATGYMANMVKSIHISYPSQSATSVRASTVTTPAWDR